MSFLPRGDFTLRTKIDLFTFGSGKIVFFFFAFSYATKERIEIANMSCLYLVGALYLNPSVFVLVYVFFKKFGELFLNMDHGTCICPSSDSE
jgi:hypothetical protein